MMPSYPSSYLVVFPCLSVPTSSAVSHHIPVFLYSCLPLPQFPYNFPIVTSYSSFPILMSSSTSISLQFSYCHIIFQFSSTHVSPCLCPYNCSIVTTYSSFLLIVMFPKHCLVSNVSNQFSLLVSLSRHLQYAF